MIDFWIVAAVLSLTAMVFIVIPMSRRDYQNDDVSEKDSNVAYYKEQQQELTAQVEQGLLSSDDAEAMRLQLERKLLSDLSGKEETYFTLRRTVQSWHCFLPF